jgi:hypothetical protein
LAEPKSVHVRLALVRIYDRRCEDDEALKSLEEILRLDPTVSGRALKHLVGLAMHNDRRLVADRMSKRLTELQEEERRLGARAPSQRVGIPATQGAHLLRGSYFTADKPAAASARGVRADRAMGASLRGPREGPCRPTIR